MELSLIYSKPSAVLRALTEARLLMANHARELTEAMDELIVAASHYIDEQGKKPEPGDQEEEDQVREEVVKDARMVAKILLSHGGDAARAALGVPAPQWYTSVVSVGVVGHRSSPTNTGFLLLRVTSLRARQHPFGTTSFYPLDETMTLQMVLERFCSGMFCSQERAD